MRGVRFTILGLGAVGGHLAVRLANAGHDVAAVARGATLEAVKARGLVLTSGDATLRASIEVSDDPRALPPAEFVLVTVKATAPTQLARTLAPLVRDSTAVVFAQNGIPWWYASIPTKPIARAPDLRFLDPDGALHEVVAPSRILGMVVSSPNEVRQHGVIEHRVPTINALEVGEADDRPSARVDALREALRGAGFASPAVDDLRRATWRKLMTNLASTLPCLLTGRRCTFVRDDERLRGVYFALAAESNAIAAAHGIDTRGFDPVPFAANPPDHLPSLRQDYDRHRELELDAIVLAPQRFARSVDVATPVLDTAAALAVSMAAMRTSDGV